MFRAFLGVSFFNFLAAGFGFFLNILYGKTLSIENYGFLYFLLSIVYILNYIIDGGVSQSIVVFSSNHEIPSNRFTYLKFVFNKYYKYLVISSVLSISVSAIVIYYNNLFNAQNFILLLVSGILTSISKVLISFFQGEKQWTKFNFLNLSLNFLRLLPLLLILFLNEQVTLSNVIWILIFSSLGQFIFVIFLFNKKDINNKKLYEANYSHRFKKEFSNHFHSVLGLTLMTVIVSRADILITKHYLSNKELGIYSMASSLALMFPIITNSLIQVLLSFSKEISKVNTLTTYLFPKIILILIISISLFYVFPPVINWIFSGRYDESIEFFQYLSLIHTVGLIFTPLETIFLIKNPTPLLYLKISQLLILILTPLFFEISLWIILLAVLISKVIKWVFLMFQNNKLLHLQ